MAQELEFVSLLACSCNNFLALSSPEEHLIEAHTVFLRASSDDRASSDCASSDCRLVHRVCAF